MADQKVWTVEDTTQAAQGHGGARRTSQRGWQAQSEELEAETGNDFVQTGSEPPTFVETERAVPANRSKPR